MTLCLCLSSHHHNHPPSLPPLQLLVPTAKRVLTELGATSAHNLTLANQLGVELGSVQRQVNVKVDTVEGALWSVHALEILLQVLAAKIGGEGDDFLDSCNMSKITISTYIEQIIE